MDRQIQLDKMTDEALDRYVRNLKAIRLRKYGSQVKFAKAVGVSSAIVWEWENGIHRPSFWTAVRMAMALGVDIGDMCNKEWKDGEFR